MDLRTGHAPEQVVRKLATADLAAGLPVYRTSVIVFGRI